MRQRMRNELSELQTRLDIPMVLITHARMSPRSAIRSRKSAMAACAKISRSPATRPP
jgi:ABC-type Fe3+/spermidine/putrescine transport system ATPase subunit